MDFLRAARSARVDVEIRQKSVHRSSTGARDRFVTPYVGSAAGARLAEQPCGDCPSPARRQGSDRRTEEAIIQEINGGAAADAVFDKPLSIRILTPTVISVRISGLILAGS